VRRLPEEKGGCGFIVGDPSLDRSNKLSHRTKLQPNPFSFARTQTIIGSYSPLFDSRGTTAERSQPILKDVERTNAIASDQERKPNQQMSLSSGPERKPRSRAAGQSSCPEPKRNRFQSNASSPGSKYSLRLAQRFEFLL
jgi:hypothetical protein